MNTRSFHHQPEPDFPFNATGRFQSAEYECGRFHRRKQFGGNLAGELPEKLRLCGCFLAGGILVDFLWVKAGCGGHVL
jgi:hypothetical protein